MHLRSLAGIEAGLCRNGKYYGILWLSLQLLYKWLVNDYACTILYTDKLKI